GGRFQQQGKGRNGTWALYFQADHRAAGRAHLGGIEPGTRLQFPIHATGSRRAAGRGEMSKRILVVEDQEDNRRILRDLLASAGYETLEALTGDEGVAR